VVLPVLVSLPLLIALAIETASEPAVDTDYTYKVVVLGPVFNRC
jgi:hypothetical protein